MRSRWILGALAVPLAVAFSGPAFGSSADVRVTLDAIPSSYLRCDGSTDDDRLQHREALAERALVAVHGGTPSGLFLTGLFQDKINLTVDQTAGDFSGNVYVARSQFRQDHEVSAATGALANASGSILTPAAARPPSTCRRRAERRWCGGCFVASRIAGGCGGARRQNPGFAGTS